MCDRNPFDPYEEDFVLECLPIWVYEEDVDLPWRVANDEAARTIQS
jgi:hypothetical protein